MAGFASGPVGADRLSSVSLVLELTLAFGLATRLAAAAAAAVGRVQDREQFLAAGFLRTLRDRLEVSKLRLLLEALVLVLGSLVRRRRAAILKCQQRSMRG